MSRLSSCACVGGWGLTFPGSLQLKWDFMGIRREDPMARFGKYALPLSERTAAAKGPVEEEE